LESNEKGVDETMNEISVVSQSLRSKLLVISRSEPSIGCPILKSDLFLE